MDVNLFNITEDELKQKKKNIFMGISLGVLKPLTRNLAKDYIKWALDNTKEKVAILVADEIAKFNYKIFSKYSSGKAEKRAIKEGDKHIDFFREIISGFPKEDQKKIIILRWKEIWDRRKERIKKILEEEYNSNKKFKENVLDFLKKYSKKREKILSEKEMDSLSQYILYEMSTLLDGIQYKGNAYTLLLYPAFESSGMSEFVTKIINGNLFPDLRKRLRDINNTSMVETYL